MRHKGVEYPELKGKTVRRVWFKDDDEFTALFLEFEDNTRARFDLRAAVTFERAPEMCSIAPNGDLTDWSDLKTQRLAPHES
jgi:hypothetical protein